jgi:kexin
MKIASLLSLAGFTALAHASRPTRDYDANDYYVLHLDSATTPSQVASRLGLAHEGQLGALDDHHVFRAPKVNHDIVKREIAERKRRKRDLGGSDPVDGILLSKKQQARQHLFKRDVPPTPRGWALGGRADNKVADLAVYQETIMKQLDIQDPIFKEQWHLLNPLQPGHDVNVTGLWLEGITGKNVTVAVVDDGLDMNSDDLKPNYFAEGSWDFNDNDPEPAPVLDDDRHGTRCAGEVAAARNDVCGVGVAYDSKVAGIRILSKLISDADEAEALMYKYHDNHIYSCSWGPSDDGQTMEAPDVVIRRAMLKAIQEGRNGLGSVYVFASGNGAGQGDNCNFDGYTNSIYSITVGAVDRTGLHPYYSEECSAQLVVTYSSGSGDAIVGILFYCVTNFANRLSTRPMLERTAVTRLTVVHLLLRLLLRVSLPWFFRFVLILLGEISSTWPWILHYPSRVMKPINKTQQLARSLVTPLDTVRSTLGLWLRRPRIGSWSSLSRGTFLPGSMSRSRFPRAEMA